MLIDKIFIFNTHINNEIFRKLAIKLKNKKITQTYGEYGYH